MSIYKRNGSPYWWYSFPNPHGGRRIRESTGKSDRREAQEIHDRKKAEFWKVKATGHQFYDALSVWSVASDRSINDLNAVKLIKRLYSNRPLTEVTGDSIEDALGNRMIRGRKGQKNVEKAPISAGTYNKLANIVRAALNLAKDKKKWIKSVDKIPRWKEPKSKANYITKKEFETLLSHLAEHQKPLFLFSLATGLRWANVTYLEWSRVDIRHKIAWVDADETKGGEDIRVPLSSLAMDVLKSQAKAKDCDEQYVFTYNGAPIKSPKTAFSRAKNAAGLGHITWHWIRHTWASWHAMGGTPMDVLQRLGAWKDPKTMQRYAKLAPDYLAQFADNARPYESNVVAIKRKKDKA